MPKTIDTTIQDICKKAGVSLAQLHETWFYFHGLIDEGGWDVVSTAKNVVHTTHIDVISALVVLGLENLDKIVKENTDGIFNNKP